MESIVGANAGNRGISGVQGGTGQGKTQTGRVVQYEVDTRVSGQVASLPGTPWRTTDDYEVAVTSFPETIGQTANAAEQDAFRIRPCAYTATQDVLMSVRMTLEFLEKKQQDCECDVVSYCVAVVQGIDKIISRHGLNNPASENYKFMISQLGPFYVGNLHPALKLVKSKVDEGCGWEYYTEIILIGRYLDLQPDELSANKDLMRSIYKQVLDGEIVFLNHIKDHPVDFAVMRSNDCCESLLQTDEVQKSGFIHPEEISEFHEKKQRLMKVIKENLNKDGAGININKLKEEIHCGTAHKLDRRLYLYVLQDQFSKLKDLYSPDRRNRSHEEFLSCIDEFLKLYIECTSCLGEFHSLSYSIKTKVIEITKLMMEQACIAGVQLEENVMKFILNMMADNMLNTRCGNLYLYCKELEFPPESVMRMAAQDNKITDDQCHKCLLAMELCFAGGRKTTTVSRDACLQAADMLQQLLYNHLHEIKTLPEKKEHLARIESLKTKMDNKLFRPVIRSYHRVKRRLRIASGADNSVWKEIAEKMSCHRCTLVQSAPYKFVVTKVWRQGDLVRSACFAWYGVVSELANKAGPFMEEDVDCLLALKRLAPFVPNQFLQPVLIKALNNLFQTAALPGGVDGIPDEKVATLSQWVRDLGLMSILSEQLETNNEPWEKSHDHVAHGRNTASSESVPLTSIQGSSNFQVVQRPVVLKKKELVVGVIACEVVPDADILPSFESKEKPSQKTRLTMPGALSATTTVSSPESRADLKKDKVLASRLCEELERSAHDPADHAMVIQGTLDPNEETVSAGEAGAIKTEGCAYEPSCHVQREVETSLKTLERKRQMPEMNPLLFCLAVVETLDRIKDKYDIKDPESRDYKCWASRLGPLYVSSLRPALDIMGEKASAQRIWEYDKGIIGVAKYFFLQSNESPDKSDNRKLLRIIYLMAIKCEIHYLKFARDYSWLWCVTSSYSVISRLLNWGKNKLEYSDFEPLSQEQAECFRCQVKELIMDACVNKNEAITGQLDHNNGATAERIKKLEESLRSKTANALDVRLYNDLLQMQIEELERTTSLIIKERQGRGAIQDLFPVLRQLCGMHDRCITFIPENDRVRDGVVATISAVAKMILDISLNEFVQLEKEMLELVADLMNKGLLSETCRKSYLYCKELHASTSCYSDRRNDRSSM